MQDKTNRQNSEETTDINLIMAFEAAKTSVDKIAVGEYKRLRTLGVAKEVARVILPEGLTLSTLYANGTLRSWMHYLEVREDISTQKEHRMLANKIREVLLPVFPVVLGIKV